MKKKKSRKKQTSIYLFIKISLAKRFKHIQRKIEKIAISWDFINPPAIPTIHSIHDNIMINTLGCFSSEGSFKEMYKPTKNPVNDPYTINKDSLIIAGINRERLCKDM